MLLPFCPRRPHRFATPTSCEPSPPKLAVDPLLPGLSRGLGGPSCTGLGLPPRMEDTEECAQRACLRMTEVTDMHSEMTSATGSTATATGRLRYSVLRVGPGGMFEARGAVLTSAIVSSGCASRLILAAAAGSLCVCYVDARSRNGGYHGGGSETEYVVGSKCRVDREADTFVV